MDEIQKNIKKLNGMVKSRPLSKEWLERTIISLGLYGKVSGVIGPFIIANFKGRMIIRLRPVNFRKSMTSASVANRKNMAAATKYAMFIKSVDILYNTWKKAKTEGNNAFTKLIKYNKKQLVNNSPSLKNSITPEGYQIYINDIIRADKNGRIRVNNNYVSDENEKMVIVLIALNPKLKGISNFECMKINCTSVKAGEEIRLKQWQKELCRNYSKFILYTALIREKGTKLEWSNTSVIEYKFQFGNDYKSAELMGYGQILTPAFSFVYEKVQVVKPPGYSICFASSDYH